LAISILIGRRRNHGLTFPDFEKGETKNENPAQSEKHFIKGIIKQISTNS
jgi:hypothetical protein